MAWSLNGRLRRRSQAQLDIIKGALRDVGPWLALTLGFAATALLVDLCVDCMRMVIR